ncbi:unnamed protein product, partial [marine sediment metagenome]
REGCGIANASGVGIRLRWASTAQIDLSYTDDAGTNYGADHSIRSSWIYVVLAVRRATSSVAADGWARQWINGALVQEYTSSDNYDTYSGNLTFRAGIWTDPKNAHVIDVDELKLSFNEYPEPHVPGPPSNYPDAKRTVVLYRATSTDSAEFAQYCVSELGAPDAISARFLVLQQVKRSLITR